MSSRILKINNGKYRCHEKPLSDEVMKLIQIVQCFVEETINGVECDEIELIHRYSQDLDCRLRELNQNEKDQLIEKYHEGV